ncbi:hypothetical protein EDC96DRAFT_468244 [Choanephora cucurbitarum]|nr:hypothetical protein EDC96DRAFT_468244 [Choanephora cucurbitarum]
MESRHRRHSPSESPAPYSDREGSTPRKRTRATPEQLAILEKSFDLNPSPNSRVREQLSRELGMSERSIQIWFQNRRAKVKNVAKKTTMLQDETLRMQYYASTAAAAACQAAAYREQQLTGEQKEVEDPISSNPDLYYYYYYYYFNQQQSHQRQKHLDPSSPSSSVPPPPVSLKTMPPPPPPPPPPPSYSTSQAIHPMHNLHSPLDPLSPSDTMRYQKKHSQRTRAHTIGPYPNNAQRPRQLDRGASVEIPAHKALPNNYTNLLNMSTSPIHPHQTPLYTPVQDSINPFLYQSSPSAFIEQPNSVHWNNLPLYENTSFMITPTTPSMFNTANVPQYYDMTSINHSKISAEALQIGTWKRMAFDASDLLCLYNKEKKMFSWCIRDGLSRFKMDFPQQAVQKITLQPLETRAGWARIELHVLNTQQIAFYMEVQSSQNHWIQCRDYTEDKQASVISVHQLDGPALALKAELDTLAKDDSYLASIIIN